LVWRAVESLARVAPDAKVYAVHPTEDGVGEIVFGDGTHGALLPLGATVVIAAYRRGGGSEGHISPITYKLTVPTAGAVAFTMRIEPSDTPVGVGCLGGVARLVGAGLALRERKRETASK
jgi:fermentation-respiration switch protein FrsA (DUF1100 family)